MLVLIRWSKIKMMLEKDFVGKWRIIEMGSWDEEYFDAESPAYVKIEKTLKGDFHFGYVQGDMDSKIVNREDGQYLDFTFEGNNECDAVSGSGWIKLKENNHAEAEIKFHLGDESTIKLKRIKK